MASGYQSAGVDLDALFLARVGAARANVGFQVGGVDIAQRYEQRAAAAIANTGYQANGTDLAQLFEGINAASVLITTRTSSSTVSGSTPTASYVLLANGNLGVNEGGGTIITSEWITPKTGMTGYAARATLVSGTLSAGTLTTWQPLGSASVSWSRNQPSVGGITCVIDVDIRTIADSIIRGSARITLQAVRSG